MGYYRLIILKFYIYYATYSHKYNMETVVALQVGISPIWGFASYYDTSLKSIWQTVQAMGVFIVYLFYSGSILHASLFTWLCSFCI